ncbi:type IV pilin [Clostridium sp. 2-1]|uniref:prepilin-type N-terminal cleavage/methylation domain-containing protein n=1 Tax=Clostridium TaxID=1485 RepID=UPI000CDB8D3D|nr:MULTISPECIES: prepilin-type N-terminal cleavage/methylation domain-containing protein [Clostridium]MBN7574169.1 prepilin-type N-terminal cleavage/methylation domain-containing protein [Clostridium beijerinckii]MBN7579224.1 prepilin-type N-terminal cleavage/methylation domain-containing protein [Clostridium beijerinckii]MBN7583919.1 prepilin-type N-terminal cleavage/methylation domain-containing protein [Clostridium beijerinckii]MBO0519510.1 prepilin-type N-terminal cleavage/methylation domai
MTSLSIRKMNELSKKKKKGFTLVELIIVIAIIAILAAIAIPKFGQITRNANMKADIATAKNLHGIAAQLIAEGGDVTDANIDSSIAAKLDGSPAALPNTKLDNSVAFQVRYTPGTGDIVVTAGGGDEIYPTPSGDYAS